MVRVSVTAALGLAVLALGASTATADTRVHVVGEGETLWEIARSHGCNIDSLRAANELDSTLLQIGQELAVPACDDEVSRVSAAPATAAGPIFGPPKRPGILRHAVAPGDTLYGIAKRYDTSIEDLRARNLLRDSSIRVGQILVVRPGSKELGLPIPGQSVGRPQHGRLINGTHMTPARGYVLRRPERAWGANYVIHHVRRSIEVVRERFPRIHALAIGDLSAERGGRITMHASHQSGRDVDLGFYFKRRPRGYPEEFVVVTRDNIHFEANWTLIQALAATADRPGGVEVIFMSYHTQGLFYRLARERGVDEKTLRGLFQYPNGPGSSPALIRHEPAHDEHIHVRFKCPPGDGGCRD